MAERPNPHRGSPDPIDRLDPWLFAALAVLAAVPAFLSPDTFSGVSNEFYASAFFLRDLVDAVACTPWPQSALPLLDIHQGATIEGAHSLTFRLWLAPFFAALGVSIRAVSAAMIGCHLAFAAALFALVRTAMPGRRALPFALVFFLSPWYRSTVFSNTHIALALVLPLVGSVLLLRALRRRTDYVSWVLAGVAFGLCFYGYTVGRMIPLVAAGFAALAVAGSMLRRNSQRSGALGLALFVCGLLIALGTNLAEPQQAARMMFRDPEAVSGVLYPGGALAESASAARTGLANLRRYLVGNPWRLQPVVYDRILAALFVVGAVVAFLRRRTADLLFVYFSACTIGVLSFLTASVTHTRMGALCLPVLVVCGVGLESVCARVARWARPPWLGRTAAPVAVLLFACASVPANRAFVPLEMRPAPVFAVARALAARPAPLRTVIATGAETFSLRGLHAVSMALVEAGRTDEACRLVYLLNPGDEEARAAYLRAPESTVLVDVGDWAPSFPIPGSIRPIGEVPGYARIYDFESGAGP